MAQSLHQYTDFFMAYPDSISAVQSFEDITVLIFEYMGFSAGGQEITPERFAALAPSIIGAVPQHLQPVELAQLSSVQLYLLVAESCRALAETPYESLLAEAVSWAEASVWQETDINPFDLAGFLVSLRQLCQEAHQRQMAVYLLVADEAHWHLQRSISDR